MERVEEEGGVEEHKEEARWEPDSFLTGRVQVEQVVCKADKGPGKQRKKRYPRLTSAEEIEPFSERKRDDLPDRPHEERDECHRHPDKASSHPRRLRLGASMDRLPKLRELDGGSAVKRDLPRAFLPDFIFKKVVSEERREQNPEGERRCRWDEYLEDT